MTARPGRCPRARAHAARGWRTGQGPPGMSPVTAAAAVSPGVNGEAMIAIWRAQVPSIHPAADGGQQPLEVLSARAARLQVRRDARVPLLCWFAGGHQLGVDVQHLHRLVAAHIPRISLQEAVQRRPAVHERPTLSWPRYPSAAKAALSLRRASNNTW